MQPWKGNFKFRHKFWITKPFKGHGSAIGFHSGSPVSQSTDNPRETSSSNELMTFDTNSSKISKQTAQMKSDLNHKNHNYISVLSLVSVRPLSWIACHQIAAQIIGGLNANYNMFGSNKCGIKTVIRGTKNTTCWWYYCISGDQCNGVNLLSRITRTDTVIHPKACNLIDCRIG